MCTYPVTRKGVGRREGKGREGKGREGKGKGGKEKRNGGGGKTWLSALSLSSLLFSNSILLNV